MELNIGHTGFELIELSVSWKQTLYLYRIGVRTVYILPPLDPTLVEIHWYVVVVVVMVLNLLISKKLIHKGCPVRPMLRDKRLIRIINSR